MFIMKEEINEDTIQEAPSALVSDHVDVPIFYAMPTMKCCPPLYLTTHLQQRKMKMKKEKQPWPSPIYNSDPVIAVDTCESASLQRKEVQNTLELENVAFSVSNRTTQCCIQREERTYSKYT